MLFTIKPIHGIKIQSYVVWDEAASAPLCEFVDGECITDDQNVIEKLTDLGYIGVGLEDVPDPVDPVNPEKLIRNRAQELDIKYWHTKAIKTLEKEIAEIEGA